MKKAYKLLQHLYHNGSFDISSGFPKEVLLKETIIPVQGSQQACDELLQKGYLDPQEYRDLGAMRPPRLIVTEKGKDFVTDYINKNHWGKLLYWCRTQNPLRPFISLIISVGALAVSITALLSRNH